MIADLLPSQSGQEEFFEAFQRPLKKSISIMTHCHWDAETEAWQSSILNTNFLLSKTPFTAEFPDTVYVDRDDTSIALGKTRQHLTGQFYIQEVAASLPANILKEKIKNWQLKIEKPLKILDLCAAPWGKTAQLADYLLAHTIPGIVWGNDVDSKRLGTRATNIQRCGLYNTVATKIDGTQIWGLYPELFDAILVDAPCSGEGTGFKSDAAYKRRKSESINKIVGLQEQIVTSAIDACKVWGIVIYSTCTLNPFENEIQIQKLFEKYGDALEILPIEVTNKSPWIAIHDKFWIWNDDIAKSPKIDTSHFLRCRPHIHHTGWFFVCAMRKRRSTSTMMPTKDNKSTHHKTQKVQTPYTYNKQTENAVRKVLLEQFGISLDLSKYAIIAWKHKIVLADASARELVEQGVRFQECGIPILKPTGKTYSLEHEIALTLWHLATKNTIDLTEDELQRYCLSEDIIIPTERLWNYNVAPLCNWYSILTHKGTGVGVGKVIDGTIKNKFFKW
jgi:16S rRNA (cytosine1407-C5)-methyltransferase